MSILQSLKSLFLETIDELKEVVGFKKEQWCDVKVILWMIAIACIVIPLLCGCCVQNSSRTVTTVTEGEKVTVTETENSNYEGYLPPWSNGKQIVIKK